MKSSYANNATSIPQNTIECVNSSKSNETQRCPQFFSRERINLESHQLILLSKSIDQTEQDEILFTSNQLRQIVDYTKRMDNIEETLQFIEATKDTITFLICSGSLGQIIIPQIHTLKNIRSIYVYCRNQQYHKQWSIEYPKIKEVYIDLDLLLNDLRSDVEHYLQEERNDIFSGIGRDNYTLETYTFSWWNYVISLICHLTYPEDCRQNFLQVLRSYYQNKEVELKILDEFERSYASDSSVLWYTRNTFLYLVINTALRQKNIEVIFLFAFFIKDIYVQLKNQYEIFRINYLNDPKINVYRAQIISLTEINLLKQNGRDFINNSFFSTTLDCSYALFILGSSTGPNDETQRVLFEIEIDVRLMSQPFGLISNLSYFPNENEVLFMIGTYFKTIQCVYDDDKHIYIAKLRLEDDSFTLKRKLDLAGLTPRATLKAGAVDISKHLYRVGEIDINIVFDQLFQLFPNEKQWLNAIRHHTIAILYRQYNWLRDCPEYVNIVLSNYHQALTIYQAYLNDKELDCALDIADIYYGMGKIYHIYVQDYLLANEKFDLGICFCNSSLQTITNIDTRIELYHSIVLMYEYKALVENDESQRKGLILDAIKYQKLQFEEMLSCLLIS
ncbi:unnamed protein product [Adineta steineri]|uniref:Uncharacterized protein n=1 Tax=Adineta steineri TaxID=433720 RepID=A0A815DYN9_9BILA|nr:unnamed protein product [Adineta steineri]CAF3709753.1 unnamed protein product [Adineta steineri]